MGNSQSATSEKASERASERASDTDNEFYEMEYSVFQKKITEFQRSVSWQLGEIVIGDLYASQIPSLIALKIKFEKYVFFATNTMYGNEQRQHLFDNRNKTMILQMSGFRNIIKYFLDITSQSKYMSYNPFPLIILKMMLFFLIGFLKSFSIEIVKSSTHIIDSLTTMLHKLPDMILWYKVGDQHLLYPLKIRPSFNDIIGHVIEEYKNHLSDVPLKILMNQPSFLEYPDMYEKEKLRLVRDIKLMFPFEPITSDDLEPSFSSNLLLNVKEINDKYFLKEDKDNFFRAVEHALNIQYKYVITLEDLKKSYKVDKIYGEYDYSTIFNSTVLDGLCTIIFIYKNRLIKIGTKTEAETKEILDSNPQRITNPIFLYDYSYLRYDTPNRYRFLPLRHTGDGVFHLLGTRTPFIKKLDSIEFPQRRINPQPISEKKSLQDVFNLDRLESKECLEVNSDLSCTSSPVKPSAASETPFLHASSLTKQHFFSDDEEIDRQIFIIYYDNHDSVRKPSSASNPPKDDDEKAALGSVLMMNDSPQFFKDLPESLKPPEFMKFMDPGEKIIYAFEKMKELYRRDLCRCNGLKLNPLCKTCTNTNLLNPIEDHIDTTYPEVIIFEEELRNAIRPLDDMFQTNHYGIYAKALMLLRTRNIDLVQLEIDLFSVIPNIRSVINLLKTKNIKLIPMIRPDIERLVELKKLVKFVAEHATYVDHKIHRSIDQENLDVGKTYKLFLFIESRGTNNSNPLEEEITHVRNSHLTDDKLLKGVMIYAKLIGKSIPIEYKYGINSNENHNMCLRFEVIENIGENYDVKFRYIDIYLIISRTRVYYVSQYFHQLHSSDIDIRRMTFDTKPYNHGLLAAITDPEPHIISKLSISKSVVLEKLTDLTYTSSDDGPSKQLPINIVKIISEYYSEDPVLIKTDDLKLMNPNDGGDNPNPLPKVIVKLISSYYSGNPHLFDWGYSFASSIERMIQRFNLVYQFPRPSLPIDHPDRAVDVYRQDYRKSALALSDLFNPPNQSMRPNRRLLKPQDFIRDHPHQVELEQAHAQTHVQSSDTIVIDPNTYEIISQKPLPMTPVEEYVKLDRSATGKKKSRGLWFGDTVKIKLNENIGTIQEIFEDINSGHLFYEVRHINRDGEDDTYMVRAEFLEKMPVGLTTTSTPHQQLQWAMSAPPQQPDGDLNIRDTVRLLRTGETGTIKTITINQDGISKYDVVFSDRTEYGLTAPLLRKITGLTIEPLDGGAYKKKYINNNSDFFYHCF